MRALHQTHPLLVEVADQRVERVRHRHVIGVEHQDEGAPGARQGRIDVAGLGVGVVGPDEVARAGRLRKRLHLGAPPVVQQPGDVRIGKGAAAGQGRGDHLDRFVVGADIDVDRVSRGGRRALRRRPRPGEPGHRRQRPEAVDLGHQQHREGDGIGPLAAPAKTPDQVGDAPKQRPDRQEAQQQLAAFEESSQPSLSAIVHDTLIGPAPGLLEPWQPDVPHHRPRRHFRIGLSPGGVPEWLNGAVSKTVGVARRSWVRIPPPPL